jgi:hypothetical protein
MATNYTCDGCGKPIEGKATAGRVTVYKGNSTVIADAHDLCEGCTAKFADFVAKNRSDGKPL